MSYEGVRGHEAAIRILREAVSRGRVASGYLLFGPEGVGKAMVARRFARAILCPEGARTGDACGECPACVRSASGSHPGLVEIERESRATQLRVSQIHDLAEKLSLRPLEGESKVAVLDDVERANEESFNALLKTLEEPPPRTTLVLVTSNREVVPETVRSRCQGVRFGPLPRADVRAILSAVEGLEPEDADALAELAAGSPGRALRLRELGYPEKARETEGLFAEGARADADPIEVARKVTALLATGGRQDKRDRVREALVLLAEHVRSRFLGQDRPRREPGPADRCLKAIATGLGDLGLNVTPESVLRATLIRVLPEFRGAGGTAKTGRSR